VAFRRNSLNVSAFSFHFLFLWPKSMLPWLATWQQELMESLENTEDSCREETERVPGEELFSPPQYYHSLMEHTLFSTVKWLLFFFFFWWHWSLNSGPHHLLYHLSHSISRKIASLHQSFVIPFYLCISSFAYLPLNSSCRLK
jgi:hypothetical protein